LDVSGLNRMLRLDGQRRLVELQAAASWSEVAAYLGEHGVAPRRPDLRELSPDRSARPCRRTLPARTVRPISVHVEAITLVTADGDVRRADRHANSDLFALAIGGHGLSACSTA
jgi:FAD/FMN-containing dehydrogenase